MKIKISKQRGEKIKETLAKGGSVEIGNVGVLQKKVRPARKAYHNFSGKKIEMKSWSRIILIPNENV